VRASEQSFTGGVGVSEVAGLFERIKWAPVENRDRHDLGTDLLVAARDPRRFDRGLVIGVQVKGGPSYFDEPEVDATGLMTGWWHRNDTEHFDYWVKHQLPHLIVLYDLDGRSGYWVHVTPERCISTGKGLKILVPKENTLSEANTRRLLDVAIQQRGSISLEGTSFDAAAVHLAPGDRLRYALLIPRLVAPHANQNLDQLLEPEEGVALLTLLHPQRLTNYIKGAEIWDDLNLPPRSVDWRWHFAFGLWRYVSSNKTDALEASYVTVADKSARSDWRVAAVVALASAWIEGGELDKATALIHQELKRDAAGPIDHGWLLVRAANCASLAGHSDIAKEMAAKALDEFRLDADDATASLLAGVAYRIMFNLTSWLDADKNFSATLRAGDNAGSWWRDQQLRWALDAVALEGFRAWAQESASRWEAEPPGQQLRPSALMALFTGDHAGWSAAERRLGRYEIQRATTVDEYLWAFARLVRSGDKESVLLAGRHVCQVGPAVVLTRISALCTPQKIGHQVDMMLAFWGEFGDIGEQSAANDLIEWCLQRATQPPPLEGRRRVSMRQLIEAILVALPAAAAAIQNSVAQRLRQISIHWTDLNSFVRLTQVLAQQVPDQLDADHLLELAQTFEGHSEAALLIGVAARAGSAHAKTQLLEASSRGNLVAAQNALYNQWLDEEAATNISATIMAELKRESEDSKNGRIETAYAVDRALLLARVFLQFPGIAVWQSIADYLGDPYVAANHKRRTVLYLGRERERLRSEVSQLLLTTLPGLSASKYLPENIFNFAEPRKLATDLCNYLGWTLGTSGLVTLESFVISAFASGDFHKLWAWELLSGSVPDGYDLVAMQGLSDPEVGVRVRCAQFLARRVKTGADSETLRRAAQTVLSDAGTLLPEAFLTEISAVDVPWIKTLVEGLKDHVSAVIRAQVREILEA
jgi:hypothetical protein